MSDSSKTAPAPGDAYLMSFARLMRMIAIDPDRLPPQMTLSHEQFMTLIKTLLKGVSIDEDWYRRRHPDVAEAIDRGTYSCAKQHFVEDGYFEGRQSGPVVVDTEWYLQHYPDVAEGIAFGEIASAQRHFEEYGEAEDRLPREW